MTVMLCVCTHVRVQSAAVCVQCLESESLFSVRMPGDRLCSLPLHARSYSFVCSQQLYVYSG